MRGSNIAIGSWFRRSACAWRRHRVFILTSLGACLLGTSRSMLGASDDPTSIHFDQRRGLYTGPFELQLSAKPRKSVIRFTLDGSLPSETNGEIYSSPLLVTNTTVVRALAFAAGRESGETETRSFILPGAVASQNGAGYPESWGANVPAAYAVKPASNSAASSRKDLEAALRALPSLSIVLPREDLFGSAQGIYAHPQETGEAWERAASIEYIPPDDAKGFHVDCGLRIQGGWSRRPEESPKHSLRLVFHKRYGAAHLKYRLFGLEPESFSTLVLRGGNNNTWLHPDSAERRRAEYLRDPWMRETYEAMGHPSARGRFVQVYLNGLYWGVYNLTERPDAHFSALHIGGAEHDYDSRNSDKILSGDAAAWTSLFALANAGVTDEAQYASIRELLDVPAFIDYMILNFYGANGDWDRSSNWYATRRRDPPGPFLFLVWDGERTLEGVEDNAMDQDDDQSPTRLFQKLRENPGFRREFAQRAKLLLTGTGILSPEASRERYRRLAQTLELPILAEAARWGYYRHDVHPFRVAPFEVYNRDGYWKPEVRRLLEDYFPKRSRALIQQMEAAQLWQVP